MNYGLGLDNLAGTGARSLTRARTALRRWTEEADLMRQLGKLRGRVASFLEVEVSAFVQRLMTISSRPRPVKRMKGMSFPEDRTCRRNSIRPCPASGNRSMMASIVPVLQHGERAGRRDDGVNGELPMLSKEHLPDLEKAGFIVKYRTVHGQCILVDDGYICLIILTRERVPPADLFIQPDVPIVTAVRPGDEDAGNPFPRFLWRGGWGGRNFRSFSPHTRYFDKVCSPTAQQPVRQ
jgi:hypothetical protein